jgi:hypothetical protein
LAGKAPLQAVKLISRSQWNGGFGADSGRSRGDPFWSALRPTATYAAAICYVRFTSTPAVCATLRTEVEISAPVARTADIGFFHGGADP